MGKASILVAEDNADVLDSLRRLLELEGFNVITADNCSMALEQISQFKPNVVLTDLGMPGMTGLEFIYTLRRTSEVAHVPIIAMSSHSKKYLSAALDAGADIALHKLEGFDMLLEAINRLLTGEGPKRERATFH
ncbi:MAG TPA: response regulator [Blastocatellia bacterium]|jgi:DNA-binding response OmpR family regulator|nr:response regulator [Blastocatellia bacterium]